MYFEDYLVELKAFLAKLIPEFDSLARVYVGLDWPEVWRSSDVLVGSGPVIDDWLATLTPPPPASPGQPGQPGGLTEFAPGLFGFSLTLSDIPQARGLSDRPELLRGLRRRTGAHLWLSADGGCPTLHIAAHDLGLLGNAIGDATKTIMNSDVGLHLVD